MQQIEFYRALKQYCRDKQGNCKECCFRLYCYTPPGERSDDMMNQVIQYLSEKVFISNQPDHYIINNRPCPLKMDMKGAIGYDPSRW